MGRCEKCGTYNLEKWEYCQECGTKLPDFNLKVGEYKKRNDRFWYQAAAMTIIFLAVYLILTV